MKDLLSHLPTCLPLTKKAACRIMGWACLFALAIALLGSVRVARGDDAASGPVLLDFFADWCGPCQRMRGEVDALERAGYRIERVDVARHPEIAASYRVTRIPVFILVDCEAKELARIEGVAERAELEGLFARFRAGGRRPDAGTAARLTCPNPAWRYEHPKGHRSSVVRVYVETGRPAKSCIGSGVVVRWGGKLVVITAHHVVKDARRIIVETAGKKRHKAKVLKADATWDCAVLDVEGAGFRVQDSDGNPSPTADPRTLNPEPFEPAEIEFGPSALQAAGARLESCGYGPDGRLACSTGLFQGYRRSEKAARGPDDWMVISGHARPGDSGGPVFNQRGRLVGVLWGTDGEAVVAVQAGRLHVLLKEAVPESDSAEGSGFSAEGSGFRAQDVEAGAEPAPTPGPDCEIDPEPRTLIPVTYPEPRTLNPDSSTAPEATAVFERRPTPPAESSEADQDCLRRRRPQPPLPAPPPQNVVDTDTRTAIQDIDAKLGQIVAERQAKPEEPRDAAEPGIAIACALAAAAVSAGVYFLTQKAG